MAETLNVTIDDLPELGTKAAAVAGIESLLYTALRARAEFSPLQLRYWLDAYYQARFEHEREELEGRLHRNADFYAPECKGGPPGRGGAEGESTLISQPAADSFPLKGEAFKTPITAEDMDRCGELDELRHKTLREAAEKAGLQVEDAPDTSSAAQSAAPGGELPRSGKRSHPGVSPHGEGLKEGDGAVQADPPENESDPGAAETQRKPAKPVGWTDGFEPVEIKAGGAAQAAAFKREVAERLRKLRAGGVTMPQIREEANGAITEDQLLAILESRRVPVAVYRVLAGVLDRFEART